MKNNSLIWRGLLHHYYWNISWNDSLQHSCNKSPFLFLDYFRSISETFLGIFKNNSWIWRGILLYNYRKISRNVFMQYFLDDSRDHFLKYFYNILETFPEIFKNFFLIRQETLQNCNILWNYNILWNISLLYLAIIRHIVCRNIVGIFQKHFLKYWKIIL